MNKDMGKTMETIFMKYSKFESIYSRYTKELLNDNDEGFKKYLKENIRIKNNSYFPKHGIESKQLKLLDGLNIFKFFIKVFALEEEKLIKLYRAAILIYLLTEKKEVKSICEYLEFNLDKIESNLKIAKKHFIFDRERVAVEDYELKLHNISYTKTQLSNINNEIKQKTELIDIELRNEKKDFKQKIYTLLIGSKILRKTTGKKYAIGHIITKEDLDYIVKYKYNMQLFVKGYLDNSLSEIYDNELKTHRIKKEILRSKKLKIEETYEQKLKELEDRLSHLEYNKILYYSL